MKISIISDLHLGFGSGELWDDAFEAFEEAIEKSRDCDAMLVAGDVFDTKVPTPETFVRAMELLIRASRIKTGTELSVSGKETNFPKDSLPVVAINGNHERRTKGFINPVEALERAGFLVHLHCNHAVLKNDIGLAVHGMSAIPDQFFKAALDQWNPRPLKGHFNILMLHQLFSPLTFSEHKMEILPKGFDLYVSGDLHESKKSFYEGKPFLVPGSLVVTQVNEDSLNPRGFWKLEISETTNAEFVALENQRKIYHITKEFESAIDLSREIDRILGEHKGKRPIIKISVQNAGIPANELKAAYSNSAFIHFRKASEEKRAKTSEEHRFSVKEMGRSLLLKNLKEAGLDENVFEEIFEHLLANNPEKALELLEKKR